MLLETEYKNLLKIHRNLPNGHNLWYITNSRHEIVIDFEKSPSGTMAVFIGGNTVDLNQTTIFDFHVVAPVFIYF